MKRAKFIAGALVVSMGLLGTGYAYWTDALTVTSTVSTGNFDVDYTTNTKAVAVAENNYVTATGAFNATVNKGTDVGTEDEITFTLSNLYPTADNAYLGKLTIEVQNNGTIPAKLAKVGIKEFADGKLNNNIKFKVGTQVTEVNIDGLEAAIAKEYTNVLTPAPINGVGATAKVDIQVRLQPLSGGLENTTQNIAKDNTFGIALNWQQDNAPITPPTPPTQG